MKFLKKSLFAVFLIFFCSADLPVKNVFILTQDSVVIHGTSNLHDWNEKVGKVWGEAVVVPHKNKIFDLTAININMDVCSIKSETGTVMDNITYASLKSEEYSQIIFALYSPVKSIELKGAEKIIAAKGKLTIAGVTRQVEMSVKVSLLDPETLLIEGAQLLKMTDYGVEPPKAILGTLEAGNDITISFKFLFTLETN